jgi:uncharacterized Ntn-hydrolase superfamily protein
MRIANWGRALFKFAFRNSHFAISTLVLILFAYLPAWATWSIVAVDQKTGQIVIASATCVPQSNFVIRPARDLMDLQAVVVPGKGAAVCQAFIDNSRSNQRLVFDELQKGTDPARIIELLKQDPAIESRQFGILDLRGRSAGFNGKNNQASALFVSGQAGDGVFYQIQGNILSNDDVVLEAARALTRSKGALADRVMAAMEAADAKGGDKRCTCATPPLPNAPCEGKTAHVAYILLADKTDSNGVSYNDGRYQAYISVTDQDVKPAENANPVKTLRLRYDAWKQAGAKPPVR